MNSKKSSMFGKGRLAFRRKDDKSMKALLISINSEGTTSESRIEAIKNILNGWEIRVIDTHIPFFQTSHFSRSLGFRFKIGPLISRTNQYVIDNMGEESFDLIWLDKAVYITLETTRKLKAKTKRLVHYTPDTAFISNRSAHFSRSLLLYNYAITTKSYELKNYHKFLAPETVLFAPQGFPPSFLSYNADFSKKNNGVVFVGLNDKARESMLDFLVNNKVHISLAGQGWEKFSRKFRHSAYLNYMGPKLFGADYPQTIGKYLFSWGSLSKWFPEKHTTRTFEIPACGTALLTERNDETSSFYREDEAIFYSTPEEMLEKIRYYLDHLDELKTLTQKGRQRVIDGKFDYESQLRGILQKIGIIQCSGA